MLQLAMLYHENTEQLPQGQENAPGDLYNPDGQRYLSSSTTSPGKRSSATEANDWRRSSRAWKEAILMKLTNESIIDLRDELNEKFDFYLLDKTASLQVLNIQYSVDLNLLVGAYLSPILVVSGPGILDKIHM